MSLVTGITDITSFPIAREFYDKNNEFPSCISIYNLDHELLKIFLEKAELIHVDQALNGFLKVPPVLNGDWSYCWTNGKKLTYKYSDGIYLSILQSEKYSNCSIAFSLKNKERVEKLAEEIKAVAEIQKEKTPELGLLKVSNGNLDVSYYPIPRLDIDISLHYGNSFENKYENLLKLLNEDKSGLFLLHSAPGMGKTSLIKNLIFELPEKKVVYIPPSEASSLSSPNLLSFLLSKKPDILIIEEAENCLRSRDEATNHNAVSNILNMTDGLLGDIMKIKIIATFNTSEQNIDKALLRKGRCHFVHEFAPLPPEDANKLLTHLGKPLQNKSLTLAEIYNSETDNGVVVKEKRKVGFGI